MHSTDTDRQLVSKLLNKEEAAYRQLIADYHKNISHMVSTIAGPNMAEDILQDTWLTVMQSLPRFEFRSRLKTWIYAIAINTARAYLRKNKRNFSLENISGKQDDSFDVNGHWKAELFPSQWEQDTPEDLLGSQQMLEHMDHALNKLPELQRAVLLLKDQQDMDFDEIAHILDITENNTRVLLHRARKAIQQTISRYQQEKVIGFRRRTTSTNSTTKCKTRYGFLGTYNKRPCTKHKVSDCCA